MQMISDCIDHGWNSVMIDASAHPFKTNVEMTRQIMEKAHKAGVTVEGEVGCIFSVDESLSRSVKAMRMEQRSMSAEIIVLRRG